MRRRRASPGWGAPSDGRTRPRRRGRPAKRGPARHAAFAVRDRLPQLAGKAAWNPGPGGGSAAGRAPRGPGLARRPVAARARAVVHGLPGFRATGRVPRRGRGRDAARARQRCGAMPRGRNHRASGVCYGRRAHGGLHGSTARSTRGPRRSSVGGCVGPPRRGRRRSPRSPPQGARSEPAEDADAGTELAAEVTCSADPRATYLPNQRPAKGSAFVATLVVATQRPAKGLNADAPAHAGQRARRRDGEVVPFPPDHGHAPCARR